MVVMVWFKAKVLPGREHVSLICQLLAYGGRLRYSVAFYASDGTGTFNLEPQVLIKGGRGRKQVIYTDAPAPENGVWQLQEVGMKEVSRVLLRAALWCHFAVGPLA